MMAIISRQECIDAYKAARKLGRKYLSERHAEGQSGFLPVLESILHDTCAEFPLGIYEIPRKKIMGTYAGGRQSAFAGNFMPLLDEDTEFSSKWQNLYQAHASEGIQYPIKVYEYLGHYYVVEGNKRVSVLSYSGAYSISADVIRLFPPRNNHDIDNAVFYEILGENKRKIISHLWFSRTGSYTQLLNLARSVIHNTVKDGNEPYGAEEFIEDCFFKFRKSYHELGLTSLRLTTGDAFLEFLNVYDFPISVSESRLKQNIKNCIPKFEGFNTKFNNNVLSDPSELPRRESIIFSSLRSKRISISFAYSAASSTWTQQHQAGKYALKRRFPELPVSEINLTGIDSCYDELSGFLEAVNPDLLFITDPRLTRLATRTSLERRSCTVLHCHPDSRTFYPTYYGKSHEPAFLCGVLAGALTRTGSVGYIMLNSEAGILTADVQAFAQGARNIRPSVRVHYRNPAAGTDVGVTLTDLAKKGCDVVWLPYQPAVPGQRKIFPGVYAHLCGIDPNGVPIKYYASSAYHWEEFYNRLLKEILSGSSQLSNYSIHFRLGLSNGLLNVHPIYPSLTEWTRRLLSQYRHLISTGHVSCLDENMVVELME